ncbi:DNA repair protein XRCC4-like [Anguilla rostrata]|uniref:DNA repair protein XRCC4-like n=1 Tax=Anguilla rostrata TaxID=7938 RepID=UPI0030CA9C9A
MSVSVRGISVSNRPGHSFFLKVAWREQLGRGFTVILSDGVSAWDGKVSASDVIRESEEMEIQMEKYVQDLQLALTEEGQQAKGYTFHLSPDSAQSGVLHLSYEKAQKDISFRLGSVELQPVAEPCEVIKALISHGLERSGQLQASSLHLREQNQRLREEQDHMTAEMDRYVHGKDRLEKELYSRFALVLNEKKAKIRSLTEKIQELEEDLGKKEQRQGSLGKRGALREEEDEGETGAPMDDDYGGSTDEEQSQSPPRTQARTAPLRGPELPSHSPIEESLTDIDVAPSRKRRQRHLQGPGSEVKKGVQEVQKKESTEPARSKAEANRKASRRSAAIATTSKPTETDDLFDDF